MRECGTFTIERRQNGDIDKQTRTHTIPVRASSYRDQIGFFWWIGTRATISNQMRCETRRRSKSIVIECFNAGLEHAIKKIEIADFIVVWWIVNKRPVCAWLDVVWQEMTLVLHVWSNTNQKSIQCLRVFDPTYAFGRTTYRYLMAGFQASIRRTQRCSGNCAT